MIWLRKHQAELLIVLYAVCLFVACLLVPEVGP